VAACLSPKLTVTPPSNNTHIQIRQSPLSELNRGEKVDLQQKIDETPLSSCSPAKNVISRQDDATKDSSVGTENFHIITY
jgi:hypothetical protein